VGSISFDRQVGREVEVAGVGRVGVGMLIQWTHAISAKDRPQEMLLNSANFCGVHTAANMLVITAQPCLLRGRASLHLLCHCCLAAQQHSSVRSLTWYMGCCSSSSST
jgi:hypothetical protein